MVFARARARRLISSDAITVGHASQVVQQTAAPKTIGRPGNLDLALLAVAVLAVSTSAPLVREAAAPAFVIALYRNLFASTALVPVAFVRHRDEVRSLKTNARDRRLSLLAGVTLAGHFAAW